MSKSSRFEQNTNLVKFITTPVAHLVVFCQTAYLLFQTQRKEKMDLGSSGENITLWKTKTEQPTGVQIKEASGLIMCWQKDRQV